MLPRYLWARCQTQVRWWACDKLVTHPRIYPAPAHMPTLPLMAFWLPKWGNWLIYFAWPTDRFDTSLFSDAAHWFEFRLVVAQLYFYVLWQQVLPSSTTRSAVTKWENREFSVGFTQTTLGRAIETSHWACRFSQLLQQERQWVCLPECTCVCGPSWTALQQLTVTEGHRQGLPLASRTNTYFFFQNTKSCEDSRACDLAFRRGIQT